MFISYCARAYSYYPVQPLIAGHKISMAAIIAGHKISMAAIIAGHKISMAATAQTSRKHRLLNSVL